MWGQYGAMDSSIETRDGPARSAHIAFQCMNVANVMEGPLESSRAAAKFADSDKIKCAQSGL